MMMAADPVRVPVVVGMRMAAPASPAMIMVVVVMPMIVMSVVMVVCVIVRHADCLGLLPVEGQ